MTDNLLPPTLVLLLFGVANPDSPAAKEIEERYQASISKIVIKAIDDLLEKNPNDKELDKVMKAVLENKDFTKIKLDVPVKLQEKFKLFSDDLDERISNYNKFLLDVQSLNLGTMEVARLVDYLEKEKRTVDSNLEDLAESISKEYPEFTSRLQSVTSDKAKQSKSEISIESSVSAPETPIKKVKVKTLEELAGQQSPAEPKTDTAAIAVTNQPVPVQPAPTSVQNQSELNIVDQSAPSDNMLEKQFSPQIHLGGVKGAQPINTPK
jgi:hypothetical protein